ncbi:hypothetical protein [Halorussus sp. MSC15.2]|uniref:DUF7312 domain-containing protein n=1 Tax=Halorussus sp. MSC15.2 TaxID=2283638 RepID=UPI0013D7BD9C|nr:hypothetical protein [Halorussus sp. MSC15.2]NEU57641.1 hypothetical protein [Halorussus sp. MSC15.2]
MSDWKYETDEVGEDGYEPEAADESLEPLEPGSPSVENALFVALGVGTMLFVFARIVLLAG